MKRRRIVATYVIPRLLLIPLMLLIISFGVLFFLRLTPGDVVDERLQNSYTPERAAALRKSLGLDDPLWKQYPAWLGRAVQGDLGKSFISDRSISGELQDRLPVTVELVVLTLFLQILVAIPLGCFAALRQNRLTDHLIRVLTIVGLAVPSFWLATLVLTVPANVWHWSPPFGYVPIWEDPVQNLKVYAMPAVVGSVALSAVLVRLVRAELLEVLRTDYVRTARAKGLRSGVVVGRHALRNALIPVVTVLGLAFGAALGGTVIIETIFALPGLGSYGVTAVQQRDYPVVQAFTVLTGFMFLLVNLLVDLLYGTINPRIRFR